MWYWAFAQMPRYTCRLAPLDVFFCSLMVPPFLLQTPARRLFCVFWPVSFLFSIGSNCLGLLVLSLWGCSLCACAPIDAPLANGVASLKLFKGGRARIQAIWGRRLCARICANPPCKSVRRGKKVWCPCAFFLARGVRSLFSLHSVHSLFFLLAFNRACQDGRVSAFQLACRQKQPFYFCSATSVVALSWRFTFLYERFC